MDEMTDEATRSPVPSAFDDADLKAKGSGVVVGQQPALTTVSRSRSIPWAPHAHQAYMHACTQAGRTRYDRGEACSSSRVCVTCMVETQTRAADRWMEQEQQERSAACRQRKGVSGPGLPKRTQLLITYSTGS